MRALSLTQPFASLVAIGAKHVETRRWATTYRGLLAIHAAKGFPGPARAICQNYPFRRELELAGFAINPRHWYDAARPIDPDLLPLGAIVAVVHLTGIFATPPNRDVTLVSLDDGFLLPPAEPELTFGDYSPGRFAWRLDEVQRLSEPVPCRGALGLWDVPADVLAKISALTARA